MFLFNILSLLNNKKYKLKHHAIFLNQAEKKLTGFATGFKSGAKWMYSISFSLLHMWK